MTIEDLRRDRRLLRILDRLFLVANLTLLAWCIYLTVALKRLDPFYATLYFTMVTAGLARIVIWKTSAVPELVRALRGPAADQAWAVIEAHRHEVLGKTELWALPHEPDLETLDRAGIVARLERAKLTRWRPIMWWWIGLWCVGFSATMIGMILYEPALQSHFS